VGQPSSGQATAVSDRQHCRLDVLGQDIGDAGRLT
jgi:hypothetical protein